MDIERYCEEHSSSDNPALSQIYRSVMLYSANPQMASTPYQGLLLQMLAAIAKPRIAIEVGSYAGYGAVCIAKGLPQDSTLHIIEVDEEHEDSILRHTAAAGVADKVLLHIGPALDVIPTLPDGIGFAFVDADKVNYSRYYDLLLPKMETSGLLLFDNMLWHGRVEDNPTHSHLRCNQSTRIIQELNTRITADPRVQNILLPIRDGLMLCRIISPNDNSGIL